MSVGHDERPRARLAWRWGVLHKSGYIPSAALWRNGTIYGIVFLLSLLFIGLPLL